jgi:FkbM family methyltransferase
MVIIGAVEIPSFAALTKKDVRIKIVDIGANPIDGNPPYACLLKAGIAELVGFEPNPAALAELNTKKSAAETYLPSAVGDGARHRLHICQAPGMTSLLSPNPQVLNLFHGFPEWGRVVETVEVDTVRLDDVPETKDVDFIKIDIQGGELLALSNAEERLRDALVIQSEVEFLQMYQDQPLFSEVEQYLRRQGFMFHRFFPESSRVIQPLMVDKSIYSGLSQLFWADAVFVRDITRLDALSNRQLLAMATIVHDLYGSIDLSFHLLNEYDRRTGETVRHAYLGGLQGSA